MNKCVSPLLLDILSAIMEDSIFNPFRLVGGTNLALQYKHRESVDIDLFTDAEYGSLNFKDYENWFKAHYPYVDSADTTSKIGMGRMYYVGYNKDEAVKVDLIYESESFLFPEVLIHNVRMADSKEIGVMKLDAIFNGGRKKDFWDLHYLLVDKELALVELISLHKQRFPYQHEHSLMLSQLCNFEKADDEPDPKCELGKFWDSIKLDILDMIADLEEIDSQQNKCQ
ncbi:MAG: nucleotidyl transferase AbiEii/AbiGii toxin family protein [Muribaculaceae bacterium]|nr:nucleotidyl transferase AbiEii/AbiGii toxin family protein [Muribaculaceae bacterium]